MDGSRVVCAGCWLVALAFALTGLAFEDPSLLFLAWCAAVVMTFVTLAAARPTADERLMHRLPFRGIAAAVLGVALAGCVLALLPTASDVSQSFGIYFAIAALLAYRVVVARGARRAVTAVLVLSWTWLPFVVVTSIGCKCAKYARPAHWTENASELVLAVFLLTLPVLVATALLAFHPRRDALPDARAL